MLEIGKLNTLTINRFTDFGAYLDAGNGVEILLPKRYLTPQMQLGDNLEVFVFNDSEDRLVAVTDRPKAMVGEFAFLQVKQVNEIGAFMDWGLPKDLLVPFREQGVRMQPKRWYIVYIYLDDNSKRIAASAKLDKFLGNKLTHYKAGDVVDIIVAKRTELGYKCIVDSVEWGLLFHNELFTELNIGEHHTARIKAVRPSGKIDLVFGGKNRDRASDVAEHILSMLQSNRGRIPYCDKSTPEDIQATFSCSKKDFKKALGMLYKRGCVELSSSCTLLKAK